MQRYYWQQIIDYFYQMQMSDVDPRSLHQLKRCLLDYLGCSIYASNHNCADGLKGFILADSHQGRSTAWFESQKLDLKSAAFLNACRTSSIELDDVSGIGASVHPGVYIWSSALAAYEVNQCSVKDLIRSVLFGYDICMRMGLLASEKVREFGLHGPGLIGGLGASVTAGMVLGSTRDQLENAFAITASLLPACPFSSFLEGTDSKDLYGGWGVYLGIMAAEMALHGLTGPKGILDEEKSMKYLMADQKGKETPLGSHFYINEITFKEFSACASVHPAVSATLNLKKKNEFSLEDIESIKVFTYPFSFDLNSNATAELNVASARLSLPYSVSVALHENGLPPMAFEKAKLTDANYNELARKVDVFVNESYGNGPFAIRGAIVELYMKNGDVIREESIGSRWSNRPGQPELRPSDEELTRKFDRLSSDSITLTQSNCIKETVWNLDNVDSLLPIIEVLASSKNTPKEIKITGTNWAI
jgi:2-methylcitrate dehydratase PrpD